MENKGIQKKYNFKNTLLGKLLNTLDKPKTVVKGQHGIYEYKWAISTINEASNDHTYNIFAKVEAVHIYDGLVEVKLIDLKVFEPLTDNIIQIIKDQFNNYIESKHIQWEILDYEKQ